LLARDGLDLDMLEERAHEVLNYGRDDEVIILLPNGRGTIPQ
jgi:cell division protein FtsB